MLRARKWQRSHINHEEPGLICEIVSVSNSFVKSADYFNGKARYVCSQPYNTNQFILGRRDFTFLHRARQLLRWQRPLI